MNKELVEHELSLPTVFDLPLRAFCLYHQADFERLTDEQKQNLIEYYGMTIKINQYNILLNTLLQKAL